MRITVAIFLLICRGLTLSWRTCTDTCTQSCRECVRDGRYDRGFRCTEITRTKDCSSISQKMCPKSTCTCPDPCTSCWKSRTPCPKSTCSCPDPCTKETTRFGISSTTPDRLPCSTPMPTNGISDEGATELSRSPDKDHFVGFIIGAGIGGAVVGVACTAFFFICASKTTERTQKRETLSQAMGNPTYHTEESRENQSLQDKGNRKSVVCHEIIDKTDTYIEKQGVQPEAGVYSHLNETDGTDRSDYYDHAKPVPSQSTQDDGYQRIQIGIGNTADPQGKILSTEGKGQPPASDEYFVLEVTATK